MYCYVDRVSVGTYVICPRILKGVFIHTVWRDRIRKIGKAINITAIYRYAESRGQIGVFNLDVTTNRGLI